MTRPLVLLLVQLCSVFVLVGDKTNRGCLLGKTVGALSYYSSGRI